MDNLELWYRANLKHTTISEQPPITFTANGEPLTDWTICGVQGGVGERTENIFDYDTITTGYRLQWMTGNLFADSSAIMSDYIEVEPNVTYSIDRVLFIYGYTNDKTYLGVYKNNSFIKEFSTPVNTFTVPQNCSYIRLMSYNHSTLVNISISQDTTMVSGNIAPTEYIPYGYKIPVICGGKTTNIYIGDDQLEEGESVSYAENGTQIPTSQGTNTLTVNTTVQPSSVSVTTPGAVPEGLRKYLQCKYDVQRGAAN